MLYSAEVKLSFRLKKKHSFTAAQEETMEANLSGHNIGITSITTDGIYQLTVLFAVRENGHVWCSIETSKHYEQAQAMSKYQ